MSVKERTNYQITDDGIQTWIELDATFEGWSIENNSNQTLYGVDVVGSTPCPGKLENVLAIYSFVENKKYPGWDGVIPPTKLG